MSWILDTCLCQPAPAMSGAAGRRDRQFDKITVRELGDVRTLPPGAVG